MVTRSQNLSTKLNIHTTLHSIFMGTKPIHLLKAILSFCSNRLLPKELGNLILLQQGSNYWTSYSSTIVFLCLTVSVNLASVTTHLVSLTCFFSIVSYLYVYLDNFFCMVRQLYIINSISLRILITILICFMQKHIFRYFISLKNQR